MNLISTILKEMRSCWFERILNILMRLCHMVSFPVAAGTVRAPVAAGIVLAPRTRSDIKFRKRLLEFFDK